MQSGGYNKLLVIYLCGFWATCDSFAADHYVSLTGDNKPPYANWANASTNIQWAVNAATNGDTVWVTNGNYCLTNQIVITNGISLKSVNGWSNTIVNGNYPNVTNRCLFITNAPFIGGFTITNGYAPSNDFGGAGGGVYAASGIISNCLVAGNTAGGTNTVSWYRSGGGGIYVGVGTVLACTVKGNVSFSQGGGVLGSNAYLSDCYIVTNICTVGGGGGYYGWGRIVNSTIISNVAAGNGGGVYANDYFFMSNCTVMANYTFVSAGGIYARNRSSIYNSTISNNAAAFGYNAGGIFMSPGAGAIPSVINSIIVNNRAFAAAGIYLRSGGIARQCLIVNNVINSSSGYGGGVHLNNIGEYGGYCDSCTIVSNWGYGGGGGISLVGTNNAYSVSNCVIWGNTATNTNAGAKDIWDTSGSSNRHAFCFTCANYTNFAAGQGNITNDPKFVDFNGGNYRLSVNSPCINVGLNENWMAAGVDFDGRPRIRYGTVDMGCYEHIRSGTIFRY